MQGGVNNIGIHDYTSGTESSRSLTDKKVIQRAKSPLRDQDYSEINQLKQGDIKTALILEEVLGKRMVLMLYSKQPKIRSQALVDLNRGLTKFDFSKIDKRER